MQLAHHLGDLHGFEQALVAIIAVGPFLVLAAVVVVLRRREPEAGPDEPQAPVDRP